MRVLEVGTAAMQASLRCKRAEPHGQLDVDPTVNTSKMFCKVL
jgi:hypothetical protein